MKSAQNETIARQWLRQEIEDTTNELIGVLVLRSERLASLDIDVVSGILSSALRKALIAVQIACIKPNDNDDLRLDTALYANSLKNRQKEPQQQTSHLKSEQPAKRKWQRKPKPVDNADITTISVLSPETKSSDEFGSA